MSVRADIEAVPLVVLWWRLFRVEARLAWAFLTMPGAVREAAYRAQLWFRFLVDRELVARRLQFRRADLEVRRALQGWDEEKESQTPPEHLQAIGSRYLFGDDERWDKMGRPEEK